MYSKHRFWGVGVWCFVIPSLRKILGRGPKCMPPADLNHILVVDRDTYPHQKLRWTTDAISRHHVKQTHPSATRFEAIHGDFPIRWQVMIDWLISLSRFLTFNIFFLFSASSLSIIRRIGYVRYVIRSWWTKSWLSGQVATRTILYL